MSGALETVAVAVGFVTAAIAGGSFFAFSNFVMPSFTTLQSATGIAAMQAINRAAPNPMFVGALVAGGPAGVAALVVAAGYPDAGATALVVAGSVCSFASLAITMVANVPMNNRLEGLDAATEEAAGYWPLYLTRWTRWNTVRGTASMASSVAYALALG